MTIRENFKAIMHYENYDHMPVVHFGYWGELLQAWQEQGHITADEARFCGDGNEWDRSIAKKLGFDFCYTPSYSSNCGLNPGFEYKVIERRADGGVIAQNGSGLIQLTKAGIDSIPATIGTLLTGREAWEKLYKPKLQTGGRVNAEDVRRVAAHQFDEQDMPFGLHVGSLYGSIRDMLGIEALSYLAVDDEDLYAEVIHTVADICYDNLRVMLENGIRPDFAHYWEDICFKNGPLVSPAVFKEYVAPGYKRMTDLLRQYGTDIVSLDCDGCVDLLVPIWLENGVNTMFPIEVGTWGASIGPWREKYGRALHGVGGMNKLIFARDYAAVDAEIERLKPLVALGGYIPCPDHRLPPDAKWENVQYYCEQFRKAFN